MGAQGAIIMAFFGAVFAALTLALCWGLSGPLLAIPFLVFLGMASAAVVILRRPGDGIKPSAAVLNTIKWATIGEVVGLILGVNLAINLGRPQWQLPAMALVVGLHFLPIAWAARFAPFYMLGAALLVASGLGFGFGQPAISGFAAAASLWLAALAALWRDAKAKAGSAD